MIRMTFGAVLCCLPMACTAIERATLPDPISLGNQWERRVSAKEFSVDHRPWDAFLARYLSTDTEGVNRIDYRGVTASDRSQLDKYLSALQQVEPARLTRDQQLAFWINLYNAKTVDIVLDAYPVDSILAIKDGLLPTGPWKRRVLQIAGENLSLNDIEHRIVRPIFRESRIHFALNCAARSCPNLGAQAWRAEGLDAALSAAERAYVNDLRGVSVADDGSVTLSKIYTWFREDFGDTEAEILERLATRAEPPLRVKLRATTQPITYAYDWSLNDEATAPKALEVSGFQTH